MHNENNQPHAMHCTACHGSHETAANPLLPLATEHEDNIEYIHRHCAHADDQFGFCWCCGEHVAYYSDELNEANECDIHSGESVLDYPKEDAESYIEHVHNN